MERKSHQAQEPRGGDRWQLDSKSRNDGCPPVSQKEKHDDHRQHGAFDHRGHSTVILALGIIDAVVKLPEMDLRILLFDLVQFFHGLVIARYIRLTLVFFNVKAGDLPPIPQGHGALIRVLVPSVSNVTKPDGPPSHDVYLRLSPPNCL